MLHEARWCRAISCVLNQEGNALFELVEGAMPSPRHPAAVDHEHVAGDVIAGRRGEEHDGAGEIGGLTPPTCWNARRDLVGARGIVLELLGVVGAKVAGRNGVDLNAGGAPFI